jgi:hypothetical protein
MKYSAVYLATRGFNKIIGPWGPVVAAETDSDGNMHI